MGQIIALDTMIFIYLFEADARYLKQVEDIFHKMESGQILGVTSVTSVIEALSPAKYMEKPNLVSEITRFFEETSNLSVVKLDSTISLETARLRREYPILKTPDAIQIATAIKSGAKEFLTNDLNLAKLKLPQLKIVEIR